MQKVILVTAVLLLAGCAGPDPTPTTTPDPTPTTTPDPTPDEEPDPPQDPTGPPEANENRPPVVRLASSVERGIVPFNATLNMTAQDPDGDALTWVLDIGGNGTATSAGQGSTFSRTVTINETGNHTVVVVVSDGLSAVNATLVVAAVAPVNRSQMAEGTLEGKNAACTGQVDYGDGDGFVEIEVRPETVEQPFFVRFRSGSANDVFLILDAEGEELVREDLGVRHASATSTGVWAASGTVPETAALLVFVACDNLFEASGNPEEFKYAAGPDAADPAF